MSEMYILILFILFTTDSNIRLVGPVSVTPVSMRGMLLSSYVKKKLRLVALGLLATLAFSFCKSNFVMVRRDCALSLFRSFNNRIPGSNRMIPLSFIPFAVFKRRWGDRFVPKVTLLLTNDTAEGTKIVKIIIRNKAGKGNILRSLEVVKLKGKKDKQREEREQRK